MAPVNGIKGIAPQQDRKTQNKSFLKWGKYTQENRDTFFQHVDSSFLSSSSF